MKKIIGLVRPETDVSPTSDALPTDSATADFQAALSQVQGDLLAAVTAVKGQIQTEVDTSSLDTAADATSQPTEGDLEDMLADLGVNDDTGRAELKDITTEEQLEDIFDLNPKIHGGLSPECGKSAKKVKEVHKLFEEQDFDGVISKGQEHEEKLEKILSKSNDSTAKKHMGARLFIMFSEMAAAFVLRGEEQQKKKDVLSDLYNAARYIEKASNYRGTTVKKVAPIRPIYENVTKFLPKVIQARFPVSNEASFKTGVLRKMTHTQVTKFHELVGKTLHLNRNNTIPAKQLAHLKQLHKLAGAEVIFRDSRLITVHRGDQHAKLGSSFNPLIGDGTFSTSGVGLFTSVEPKTPAIKEKSVTRIVVARDKHEFVKKITSEFKFSGTFANITAEVSNSFSSTTTETSETKLAMLYTVRNCRHVHMKETELKETPKQLLQDDLSKFKEQHGSSFVTSETHGDAIIVIFEYKSTDKSKNLVNDSKISGGLKDTAEGELSFKYDDSKKWEIEDQRLTCHSFGAYEGHDLELSSSKTVDELMTAFVNLANTKLDAPDADEDFADRVPISVQTTPFASLV